MPETIAPATRINPMTTSRLAAEARAAEPVKLWQAAPLKPAPHPAVVALKAEADLVRDAAAADAARADSMTTAANITGQRIASLESERTELLARLAKIESRNFAAEKETANGTFNRFYGISNLAFNESQSLNSAVIFLHTLPTVERLAPILVKTLKARLAVVEKELESLTGAVK